jgi:hypothetical protein
VVYELVEQMETAEIAPGVLISHTVEPYLHDFSAVVAFALRATCTPDVDLSSRLLSGRRSLADFTPPAKLLDRVFDQQVWCKEDDAKVFSLFVKQLIALERKSFLAAMKAIRTYVTGLHRIVDDSELAYTLLVASVESLAQDFDGFAGVWSDVEDAKRRAIDRALRGADDSIVSQVKEAIVKNEHLALARRFREFALDHIQPKYFREDAAGKIGVLGRSDLRDALKEAYRLRSRYVHNLHTLPHLLSSDFGFSESVRSGHATDLTFQGLARLTRAVIMEFVDRRPKVDTEIYDYLLERHGVVQALLAPEYWIGRPEGLRADKGRIWLEGFLQQFAVHLQAGKAITDLGPVMARIEELLPEIDLRRRRPFISLYCLYNKIVPAESRSKKAETLMRQYNDELAAPASESLVTHHIMGMTPHWPIDQHREVHDYYYDHRNSEKSFRVPALFEAGISLDLAERYRSSGDNDGARSLLKFVTENFPYFCAIQNLEQNFDHERPIDSNDLLMLYRANAKR